MPITTTTENNVGSPGHSIHPPPREKRLWWTSHNNRVRQVIGYSCGPNNPDYWWCPEVGSSLSENHHLFATEVAALDNLIAALERNIADAHSALVATRIRRRDAVVGK